MENALRKFYWGFLFIMLGFRIQGFDIFPDVIGYVLFAVGLNQLADKNDHFRTASKFNMAMVVISLLSIYQPQNNAMNGSAGTTILLGLLLSVVTLGMSMYVVYHMFMGIGEALGDEAGGSLSDGAVECWYRYRNLQIATLLIFIIVLVPVINLLYVLVLIVASIVILISIMKFLDRCVAAINSKSL